MKKFLYLSALGAAATLLTASVAVATPITFTASGTAGGNLVQASAEFTIDGNLMTIVLSNTSTYTASKDVPGSTLTGLFFDLGDSASGGNPSLTAGSATAATIVQMDTCDNCTSSTNADVGGEFGYAQSDSGFPNGAGEGIASAGYLDTGLPGNIGNFNNGAAGTDLDSPASLDGINFGIVSNNYDGSLSKGEEANSPLVQNSVTFTLTGAQGFSAADISNVSFQYGTAFSELNIPGTPGTPPVTPVPGPDGLLLFATGLLLLAGFGYASRKKTWTCDDDARLFTSELDEDLAV